MDAPICEICGEFHASCRLRDVAACDDCTEAELRTALEPIAGAVCGNISRRSNGYLTVCLAPYGVEHEHD